MDGSAAFRTFFHCRNFEILCTLLFFHLKFPQLINYFLFHLTGAKTPASAQKCKWEIKRLQQLRSVYLMIGGDEGIPYLLKNRFIAPPQVGGGTNELT